MPFQKGHPQYNTGRTWLKKGHKINKGRKLSEEHRAKLSQANKGQVPWNKGKSVRLNPRTEFKKGNTPWNKGLRGVQTNINTSGLEKGRGFFKGKRNLKISDKNHWNWKGGIAGETQKNRAYFYFTVHKEILDRDGHKCQICGCEENLHVDHIKKWSTYPNLRFAINNCRTLCVRCHKKTKTFGIRGG